MTAAAVKPRPAITAEQIEKACADVEVAQLAVDHAELDLAAAKKDLLDIINAFGYASGKKSKRVDGIAHFGAASFGQSVEVDQNAVNRLRLYLKAKGKDGLFKKLFVEDARFRPTKDAHKVVDAVLQTKHHRVQRLRHMFHACLDVTNKNPSVKVDLKPAEKSAKKPAAKPGGRRPAAGVACSPGGGRRQHLVCAGADRFGAPAMEEGKRRCQVTTTKSNSPATS
jgi:hypothetical protein